MSTVNGCDSLVTLDLTITDVTSTVTDNGDGSYSADITGASYEWLKCTLPPSSAGVTTQTFTPTQNGDYALVTTVNNCSDTSACFTVSGVGLSELSDQRFSVFPNPVNDVLNIEMKEGSSYSYSLVDLNGRLMIQSSEILSETHTVNLDLPSGFYLLIIKQNGLQFAQPIIKN